jgi:AraC-like DNA-binding protein
LAMWQLARGITDPSTHAFWSSDFKAWFREGLGLSRRPNVVITLGRQLQHDEDPLEALVLSRRFAEQCSEVALGFSDTICGRVGESTPYLLTFVDPALSEARSRKTIRRLLEQVRAKLERVAKVQVRFGVSHSVDQRALPRCLDEAIVALEWATHEGRARAFYGDEAPKQTAARPMLFRSLGELTKAFRGGASANAVPIAVDRLMSEVVWRSGASVAAARAYVEAFHAEIAHAVRDTGALESRVSEDRARAFHAAIDEATTVHALTKAFHAHVVGLYAALREPRQAGRETKIARAVRYMESHLDRRLPLAEVARIAGYAPNYFSQLFGELYGQTFEHWLLAARIDRARQLLRTTELGVEQVGMACGFAANGYFYRAFRQATGSTPVAFRRAST